MRRVRAAIICWLALLALAGCGGGPTATTAPPTTAVGPAPQATATGKPGATRAATAITTPAASPRPATPPPPGAMLLVTNFGARHLSWVDPARGVVAQVEVGAAPWGLALAGGRAYVATAEGVAVVELAARRRLALVPYLAAVGPPGAGEYRAGGMGIAASPDGSRVYVGVHLPGGDGRLEVLDTARLAMVGGAAVGVRPFDVAVGRDGRLAYSIDHDSFTVTIVDTATLATRTVAVAPAGRDPFAKAHYGAMGPDGRLLLPIMGRVLAALAPDGTLALSPLTANTHQHGAALTPDGRRLLIVGTGPAGGATGGPSLTVLDLPTGAETVFPLARPHERVAASPDGHTAYLTGGYTLSSGGGWDGLTILDLATGTTRELPVPGLPLDIAWVGDD